MKYLKTGKNILISSSDSSSFFYNLYSMNIHLRISSVAELPRLGEGGQRPEVERLVLADQLALHLLRGADGAGPPLKCGRATCRLRQQLRSACAGRLVAGEQYGGLSLTGRVWERVKEKRDEVMKQHRSSFLDFSVVRVDTSGW